MFPSRLKRILLIPAVLILWTGLSLGTYFAWVHGADHRDFYPRWAGARLSIFNHQDPYSMDTTHQMQVMLYGHTLSPDVDQQGFAYPAQLLLVLFPFWFINDVEIATAIWEGLSVLLLLASLLALNGVRERPLPAWVILALLIWQYPLLMVFQGQITALPLLGLALGYRAYCRNQNVLAGIVLCLGVIKPELVLVPWLVMLALAFLQKRWKLVFAFGATQFVLFLLSILLAGWWVPGWLGAVAQYAAYAKPVWAPLATWNASPLLALALVSGVLLSLYLIRRRPDAAFAASIPLGMLTLPQTLLWGLTMLLVPLAMAWKGKSRWLVTLIWLLGWAFLFAPSGWWQAQSVGLPALALAALLYSKFGEQEAVLNPA